MVEKLQNYLLAFDDSWEEIYQEKEFKIAVAGRHKNMHCFFVKQIFSSKQVIPYYWPQYTTCCLIQVPVWRWANCLTINKSEFIRDFYQKATSSSYGHFLIDFDRKTSESLQFCSNITGSGPTVFYLLSSVATVIALTNERKTRVYWSISKTKRKLSEEFYVTVAQMKWIFSVNAPWI